MWNSLFVFQVRHFPVLAFLVPQFHVCCWPSNCGFEFDYHCSLRHHGSPVCRAASVGSSSSQPKFRVLLRSDLMAVVSHYSCDFSRFNYFFQIDSPNSQIKLQTESHCFKYLYLKSHRQNGSNRNLNPNGDCDFLIAGECALCKNTKWLI